MATTNTLETYDSKTIREDLTDMENMISPSDAPLYSMIAGRSTATNTKHEWPRVELNAVDTANAVTEGNPNPDEDAPNIADRFANYTQIMDKQPVVSDTSQWVDGAANVEKMAKQVSYKLKELNNDRENALLQNTAANPGAAEGATARRLAGLPTWYQTNTDFGATGANATLSGGTDGYPSVARTDGDLRAMTEDMFNDAITEAWNEGGEVTHALTHPKLKRYISRNFTGFASKRKDADDKKLINSIDIYESDFGEVIIVPDRQCRDRDVHILSQEFVDISIGMPTRQKDIGQQGHSDRRLIQTELTLEVGNEKAHAFITDIDPATPPA